MFRIIIIAISHVCNILSIVVQLVDAYLDFDLTEHITNHLSHS